MNSRKWCAFWVVWTFSFAVISAFDRMWWAVAINAAGLAYWSHEYLEAQP